MLYLALATLAPQLDPVPLLSTGDSLPTGDAVDLIADHDIADDGSWSAVVRGETSGLQLIVDGQVVVRQGDPFPGDPSRSVQAIIGTSNTIGGKYAFVTRPMGQGVSSIAVVDTEVVVDRTDVPAFLGMPAGTKWEGLHRTYLVRPDLLGIDCVLREPGGLPRDAIVVLELDANDAPIDGHVAISEGDVLSDGTILYTFNSARARVSSDGDVVWAGTSVSPNTRVLGIGRDVIARHEQPTPAAGFSWDFFDQNQYVDANAHGDWIVTGVIRDDSSGLSYRAVVTSQGIIATNRSASAVVPGHTPWWFGSVDPHIDDFGGIAYFAEVDVVAGDPGEEVWITRDFVAARETVTPIGGVPLLGFQRFLSEGSARSDSGRHLAVIAYTSNGPGTLNTSHVLHVESPVNDVYCVSNPNSTGRNGQCSVGGSDIANDNALRLSASSLPRHSFGFFIVSLTGGYVPKPGGSDGILCLDGSIGRYAPSSQGSGPLGILRMDVDLNAVPSPTGSFVATAGTTLRFQAWHRDANPNVTSNFTDAVAVTLR